MPETPETASDIQEIRFRLEAIEATQNLLVRGRAEEYTQKYLRFFEENSDLSAVYLAVDGHRSQVEIIEELKSNGLKLGAMTVSRRIRELKDEGLIELASADGKKNIYNKNRTVERLLRLSKRLK